MASTMLGIMEEEINNINNNNHNNYYLLRAHYILDLIQMHYILFNMHNKI